MSDLVSLIVIKNELRTQLFFQKCPYFDKEGRWENKIKNVPKNGICGRRVGV